MGWRTCVKVKVDRLHAVALALPNEKIECSFLGLRLSIGFSV